MKIIAVFTAIALTVCVVFASTCHADDLQTRFSIDAATGYHYDGNVGITDIDSNTGKSDGASDLDFGVRVAQPVSGNLSLRAGYRVTVTAYQQFDAFDLALHQLSGALDYRGKFFDIGANLERVAAVLDGDKYLTVTQVTPNISRLFGSKFYIRGAYTDAVKSYAGLSERSADTRSIRVDSYLLLDNMQRYISLGLRADEEDALDNSLDYTSRAAMLAYAHRFDFFRTHLDMKTRLGYEGRKYRSVSEDTIGARIDKRVKAGFYADLALGSYFGLRCRVEYSDVRSNADSINADKWIYGIGLTAEF